MAVTLCIANTITSLLCIQIDFKRYVFNVYTVYIQEHVTLFCRRVGYFRCLCWENRIHHSAIQSSPNYHDMHPPTPPSYRSSNYGLLQMIILIDMIRYDTANCKPALRGAESISEETRFLKTCYNRLYGHPHGKHVKQHLDFCWFFILIS